jgi:5-methylcytosine-specific restriction endonuclease McrA
MKKSNRKIVHDKYDGHCAYCGDEIPLKKMQIDHIEPLYRNDTDYQLDRMGIKRGDDTIENYNPSCKRCNLWKSTFTVEGFREQIQLQTERLNNYSSNYRMAKSYGLIEEINRTVKFYFETIS